MDLADEALLDVDALDDGSDEEGEAPPLSGPASTPTSCASSPPGTGDEPASPHGSSSGPLSFFHHQVPGLYSRPFFSSRRGPGRPRKEGVKLQKEGKLIRKYKTNPSSVRGAKRHRVSRDDSLEDLFDEDDFTMPAPEEPPYFPEKWPGKLCALCNLGERSQLGQGEMRQILCSGAEDMPTPSATPPAQSGGSTPTAVTPEAIPLSVEQMDVASQLQLNAPPSRRQKGTHKCKTPLHNIEHTDELSIIGHVDTMELSSLISSQAIYLHRLCFEFSPPFGDQVVSSMPDEDMGSVEEVKAKAIVSAAGYKKCAFCCRYGASIPCKMGCNKYFHLPCVLASGGFQDFPSKSSFCKEHLYQVPLVCSSDIDCRTCRAVGDLANLMTCVACGAHYHGTCVGLAQTPGVRAGWSCRQCRACQVCRGDGALDSRSISCEQCDKLYHIACLRPVMVTVPKYGWKCKCCRVCSDCGARSPGAGPSSRWHSHYTVCDSCYQQRNKGSSCPLCRRAYRAAAQRDMIRCTLCRRYVHGQCDPEAEPSTHQARRELQPGYAYVCPICKPLAGQIKRKDSIEDDNMTTVSQDSSYGEDTSLEQDPLALDTKPDVGLGKGKPFSVSSKIAKKKMGGFKFKGGFTASGKLAYQKRQRSAFLDFSRKRGSKPKMRGLFGVPGLGLQRPQAQDNKGSEEEPAGMENKMVLCSSKNKFVLTQDLCVTCGAIGTDSEGCLIACSQCGQTFHPYCAPVKVSRVVVTQGWRCLECTVCEGCGSRGDDARLVLCDDCDTTRHTYCARPPLAAVPAGAWRCERCRHCRVCGATEPGPPPCKWMNEYTECGPCASLVACGVCGDPYSDGELIIQCEPCSRWLHAACDGIRGEDDAELCCRAGYQCVLCRPRDTLAPHLHRAQSAEPPPAAPAPSFRALGLAGEYYMDEVCLTARGIHQMKQIESDMDLMQGRKKKRKFKNDTSEKDAVVQNADNEGGAEDNKEGAGEVKDEPVNPTYKEGSVWNVTKDGPVPDGFTIYTTESGITVLRRKRQRNLNKLGIGGFVVRQRHANSKNQEETEDGQPSGESPNNKRKPRRKPRSKLMEQFPPYMQEAFFGKDLIEPTKPATGASDSPNDRTTGSVSPDSLQFTKAELEGSESENEDILSVVSLFGEVDPSTTIVLNKDELDILDSIKPKSDKDESGTESSGLDPKVKLEGGLHDEHHLGPTEDSTALKNAILGPEQTRETEGGQSQENPTVPKTEPVTETPGAPSTTSTVSPKDDLSLLGVNLDAMVREGLPDMDSNDVDEIFKGYTDDSQESQESAVSFVNSVGGSSSYVQRQRLASPGYASPYHTEYSGSSQLSPAFSEGSGPWSAMSGEAPAHAPLQPAQPMMMQPAATQPATSYNQRSTDKMRADESLGAAATISAVLYANTNHPEWKTEFPNWQDRCKQILKKWRALPGEQKAPYLQRARDNRSAIRMKKAQQMSGAAGSEEKEAEPPAPPTPPVVRAPNVTVVAGGLLEADAHIRVLTPSEIMRTLPPLHHPPTATATTATATATATAPDQERACGQQRSAREAEQERMWKQLQQQRQQQTQQQQQIIHDQRVQAIARMRVDGPIVTDGVAQGPDGVPRSAFPAQRFPLYSASGETNADINRQLRDLLQQNPEKMWQHQNVGGKSLSAAEPDDAAPGGMGADGQAFRQPLPVGVRPRQPHPHQQVVRSATPQQVLLQHQHRLAGQAIEQVRQLQMQQQAQQQAQHEQKMGAQPGGVVKEKPVGQPNSEARTEGASNEEMDMGDMDKLEQDPTSMAEVGDILGGLGGDDDEELLESLTAEIGDDFNILEYADPELNAFNDADTENILDGLELADDGTSERHTKREPTDETGIKQEKNDADLRKAMKSTDMECPLMKTEVKTELDESPQAPRFVGQRPQAHQMYPGGQRAMTPVQMVQAIQQERQRFVSGITQQHVMGQVISRPQFAGQQHTMHFQQVAQGGAVAQSNAPGLQADATGVSGQQWARVGGAVGIVRQDNTIALAVHHPAGSGKVGAVQRAPPPPPYPGTPRQAPPPPPPPYPQQMGFDCGDTWGDWLRTRRPLLLQNVNQEQPLLLEELLEQEKREQERQTDGDWGGAGPGPAPPAPPPAPAPPAVPLFAGTPLAAPPPPPERVASEADRQAHQLYEQWLQHHLVFVNDQLKFYDTEVQKLRKMRKSLNSKQRQLRKAGNELAPADASELLRISNEQSVLQKHLESARKQSKQHTTLMQEYRNKQNQTTPQINQQTTILGQPQITSNQTVFTQNQNVPQSPQLQQQIERQNTINRQMQVIQNAAGQQTVVRQQTVVGPDGQHTIIGPQGRIGTIVSASHQLPTQSRIIQGGRTLVIEQSANGQQQLVRQLSVGQNERVQQVAGLQQNTMHLQQFGQQQFQTIRTAGQQTTQRPVGPQRPSMSPLHIQSPHSQSPHHSLAPQSPHHHLASPLQSPLHSQQSPLHAQQSPLHSQQSPMHSQQSPMQSQQSPMHSQQSPMHSQQTQIMSQQSTIHGHQQTALIQQQAMHQQQSPMHMQQSPMHSQQSPIQQSPMHQHQSPMHSQQSPMHPQQSPLHVTQQSPMQQQQQNSISSPQHFLQQLQVQRTSPQLPTPSRSPQIYQQTQIQSPVASHSPHLQSPNMDFSGGRFPRPAPGCSPLPTRFARPPQHQQGMRVGVSYGARQTSPLGSPQPLPSPGNPSNDNLSRQQILQRQQYSPMGGAPASPMSRSPHLVRTPTPSASPAASPAPQHDHGGGGMMGHHNAPFPPGFRYFKVGLFGGSPIWPSKNDDERRLPSHIKKVSILKRRTPPRPRFGGKTPAPMPEPSEPILIDDITDSPTNSPQNSQDYMIFSTDSDILHAETDDSSRLGYGSKSDDTDVEEIVEGEHLDDDDIVVVEPGAISPDEERIATEEDFEELIDSRKPEDDNTDEEEKPKEKPPTRTETTTKTVAVISLATPKQPQATVQQYKFVNTGASTSTLGRIPVLSATVLSPHGNTKILNEVSQATVASVSIANQTISVPVLKSLNVTTPNSGKTQMKKVANVNITNASSSMSISKPMTSVISVISSNVSSPKVANLSPVINLASTNAASRIPISILSQNQVKQKIVKTIDAPMSISLSSAKLSTLSVTHDATLPAKIFEDDVASPDSTLSQDASAGNDAMSQGSVKSQDSGMDMTDSSPSLSKSEKKSDADTESDISQHTDLNHSLCLPERSNPLLLSKADIKSPDPVPEKIPDNIMEGDDEDKSEDENKDGMPMGKSIGGVNVSSSGSDTNSPRVDVNMMKTIKAIANQSTDMVIDSNMQISSEVSQESVQISIPSPTPSQEQYLNALSMQDRERPGQEDPNPKQVESIEDMLDMLETIEDPKIFSVKLSSQASVSTTSTISENKHVAPKKEEGAVKIITPIDPEAVKVMQETVQSYIKNKDSERIMQAASVPQLSPLSQPTELATNMSNVSQQLRTIMSSLSTSKQDTAGVNSTATRKMIQQDNPTPTQVNFENLLPSSKVEIINSRPLQVQQIRHIDRQAVMGQSIVDSLPMNPALVVGSRINTLSGISGMTQGHRSPNTSPNLSPVSVSSPVVRSPAQSPLVSHQTYAEDQQVASQQIIQITQSTLHSTSASQGSSINIITTPAQKVQPMTSSILGTTLLQPARQIVKSGMAFSTHNINPQQQTLIMTTKSFGNQDNKTKTVYTAFSQTKSQPSVSVHTSSSTFLHTQLTSPLKRSKSTDDPKTEVIVGHIQPTKRLSIESVIVKSEPMETEEAGTSSDKSLQLSGQKGDESQNVLLKQLLQTTTATSSAASMQPSRPLSIQRTAPALGSITSLEAQLARPSILPTAIPQEVDIPQNSPRQVPNRETFPSRPIPTSIATPTTQVQQLVPQTTTQSLMDVRKTISNPIIQHKEEPMITTESPVVKAPTPTYQSVPIECNIQQNIKKEVLPPQQSPVQRPFTPMDVKKELLDESSQQSAASGISATSDQCKLENSIKEEFPEGTGMDSNSDILPETPSEAKKRKRREYQQKRRQMQQNQKVSLEPNTVLNQTKKRPRKGSKLEEDYDTFIDNLMVQLRQLPPMQIQEPTLTTNFAVCPLFGSGDLSKLKNKDYDIMKGDLVGEFGNARIPNVADYYNTKPFGEDEPLPEKTPASTQRGFYDQEFPPIRFEDEAEDKKLDLICKERDTDTPDSIISCSSPECMDLEPVNRFPGLKLIEDEEDDDDSDSATSGRISPVIPIIAPVPIRVKPVFLYDAKDEDDNKKIAKVDNASPLKSVDSPGSTESSENVTVTLTLTSGAAEDILGVLRDLAGILHIPPPTAYQIIERTATPPSHKLGLYRSKGRDGKEGMPIDIQSILNGAAKFCRHCDVVILDSGVKAKASEFPLLSSNKTSGDILHDSDADLYFCGTQCYESFAWRPTDILNGKSRNVITDDKSELDRSTSKDRDDFDTASTESMETDDLDIKPDIKDEKMDLSFIDSLDNDELMKEVVDDVAGLTEDMKTDSDDKRSEEEAEETERYRGIRYKQWSPGCIQPPNKYKRPTDRELTELVFRTGVAITPVKPSEDTRKCELCGVQGDGVADGVSRLLNCDVDRWVHLNCALWSDGVYETVSGALMNVDSALVAGMNATCAVCRRLGATVRCFKVRCGNVYHLGCAVKDDCVFHKNKSAYCSSHSPKGEKDNELTTLSVQRRVYVSRDEQRQVASVMLHSDMNHLIRVGGLIFLSPGHLLPHQLTAFHTPNYIYPIGYKIVRFYWSMRRANSRCRYICWISDEDGRPRFHVQAQDDSREEMAAATARAAWAKVLDAVAALREEKTAEGVLKLWSQYVTGEDLFGLTEPAVVRVLESLPGIETLTDYRFKFGRSALLEGGLAVNPSGCARCEPRGRTVPFRRPPRSLLPSTPSGAVSSITPDHPACPYSKQFVHTKSSQYKKMKLEWRNNVYLARSKIQGLGLYAARDIEKHTMVIEYIGELIRTELSELREKQYEARNRGIYMFKLDDARVVDATMSGGLARYINHSCQPNCVAEAVEVDRSLRIIIFAKRRICRGEELAYDYKFDIEDDAHKIMCMCGAPNCRKWMN